MAERVVKVRLLAQVSEYNKGMLEAANATRTVGSQAEKLAQTRQSMTLLGAAGVAMGAAVVAGVGVAVAKFAQFDQAMSNVVATGDDARQSMSELRQAAIEAGARTVFSATESANAIEELAKAGLSAKDVLSGGLNGALDLAAAGGLGVAQAAGIAATTLQQFKLKGEDASHVADLLAAGAGKAMGDVSDLSQALSQSGLVANQFGISVEESIGTLSAFASAGMLGSDAGTSFRTMLLRLANPTGEAASRMAELGINAYDTSGKFVGMAGLAGQLEKGLKGLTQEQQNAALAIIFGQDAIRGANVLLSEGARGISEWTRKVDDQGYAAKTAATRLDNLIGDWEQFTGALETAMITMGEGANGPLRALVQGLTGLVDAFNGLPDAGQQTVLWAGLAVGSIALVGGSALLAVPKIAEFKSALDTMQWSMKGISLVGGGVFVALTALVAVVGAVASAQAEAQARAKQYADALRAGGKAAEDFVADQLAMKDSFLWMDRGSATENAKKLGLSLEQVTKAVKGTSAEYDEFKDRVQAAYAAAGKTLDAGYAMEQLTNKVDSLRAAEAEARRQIADTDSARSSLTGTTKSATEAYVAQTNAVQDLRNELKSLLDSINESNATNQDAVTANARYQQALAGISDEVKRQQDAYEKANGSLDGFSLSLDESTVSGSANAAMFAELAGAAQTAADKQYAVDLASMSAKDATDKYAATLAGQKQAFIDSATAAGFNADEVKSLADRVFQMPDKKYLDMLVRTAQAQSAIDQFIFDNSNRSVPIWINPQVQAANDAFAGFLASKNANGGIYSGGVKAYANSGIEPGIYPYRPGGYIKWAEEYAEAYISMDPARRQRSEQVWVETGQRFGMLPPGGVSGAGSSEPPVVQVFIGDEEITGRVRVVVDGAISAYDTSLGRGVGRRR